MEKCQSCGSNIDTDYDISHEVDCRMQDIIEDDTTLPRGIVSRLFGNYDRKVNKAPIKVKVTAKEVIDDLTLKYSV
jgi:DNA-directed RNA polymerase subunit N (RpoN/RPB10)